MMTHSRVWVVSHDQFVIGKEIGRGAWGTVHETTFRATKLLLNAFTVLLLHLKPEKCFNEKWKWLSIANMRITFLGSTLEGDPVILMELMDTNLRSAYECKILNDAQNFMTLLKCYIFCAQELFQ